MAIKLEFTGDANAARDASFVERVKTALGLPSDARLELQGTRQDAQGGRTVEYSVAQIKLAGTEYGAANGVTVDEPANVSLRFNARGGLASSQIRPVDERHLKLVKDQVKKLAAADQIYVAAPGEEIDTDALRAKRKPWYVETDAQGRKRLKRAYMA